MHWDSFQVYVLTLCLSSFVTFLQLIQLKKITPFTFFSSILISKYKTDKFISVTIPLSLELFQTSIALHIHHKYIIGQLYWCFFRAKVYILNLFWVIHNTLHAVNVQKLNGNWFVLILFTHYILMSKMFLTITKSTLLLLNIFSIFLMILKFTHRETHAS